MVEIMGAKSEKVKCVMFKILLNIFSTLFSWNSGKLPPCGFETRSDQHSAESENN